MILKKKMMMVIILVMVTLGAATFAYSQDWPMFQNDSSNTGFTSSSGPSTGNLRWEYTTGVAPVSSPVVVDGKTYVSSIDGQIYCLDAETGASIWSYTDGYFSWSSPAVVYNKVYVSSQGRLVCLNADSGSLVWERSYSGDLTSPVVVDGKVYVGSDSGMVYIANAFTGLTVPAHSFPAGYALHASPAVTDGQIVFVMGEEVNGMVRGLRLEDSLVLPMDWTYTPETCNVMFSPAVDDGKVFASGERIVTCIDADWGTELWAFSTIDDEFVTSTPTLADGEVYIGYESRVYCLDVYTGAQVWNYTTGTPVTSTAVADGKIYVTSWDEYTGGDDGKIYCLNADTGAWI